MHLAFNKDRSTLMLTSGSEEEESMLTKIVSTLEKGQSLRYGGRNGAEPNDPNNRRMTLMFSINDDLFELQSSTDEEEILVRHLRDAIYFGSGCIHLLDHSVIDGKLSVVICTTYCKECGSPVTQLHNAEGHMCDTCRSKCEHVYKTGFVHGGRSGQLGVGKYCTKCNMGKSDTEPEIIVSHPQTA